MLGEDHPAYALSLHNLASFYQTVGRYKEAEPLYHQALDIRRRVLGEDHPDYAMSLANMVLGLMSSGRPEEAVHLQQEVLAIGQRRADRVFAVSSESAMRAIITKIRPSLNVSASLGLLNPDDTAATASLLIWVLRRKGMVFGSILHFRQAQQLLNKDPEVAQHAVALRGRQQRLSDLALPPPGADSEKVQQDRETLHKEINRLESALNRALSQQYPPSIAEEIDVEKVRRRLPRESVLVELLRSVILDFTAAGTVEQWKPAHYLAFVLHPDANRAPELIDLGDAAEIDEAIADLREHGEYFHREFVRVSDAYREEPKEVASKLQALERSEEENYRSLGRDLYERVFRPLREAIGAAETIYFAPDGEMNRVALETLVDERDRYLIESYRFAYLSSGRDLLRETGVTGQGTVVFADPDYDSEPNKRRDILGQLGLKQEGAVERAVSRDSRGLGRWEPLPGTRKEAESIQRQLKGTRYKPVSLKMGSYALEEELKALHSPRILVLSTHGFDLKDQRLEDEQWHREQARAALMVEANRETAAARGMALLRGTENPMLRSGIVLAGANRLGQEEGRGLEDGWVTAQELALLDLRGTELVVASACESGLGRVETGEGVHGLRRAFLHAGAQSLLISLSKVPDAETQQLIASFFGGLKEGQGKLESLRKAQLEMIKQRQEHHGAAHPFFWGSFILVGNPN